MLLEVEKLNIYFKSDRSKTPIHAVRDLSFSLRQGETLGVVGESGSGKSITDMALLGLLGPNAIIEAEKINFNNTDLLKIKTQSDWQKIRGKEISMIFQDPMSALNPFLTVEYQLIETMLTHLNISKKEAKSRCIELLEQVGIKNPQDRLKVYPFELSGGMAQRVMIAMSISTNPKLLIADEPTTALDVTIQKQILELIKELQVKNNMSVILVTHDLGVVANYSDRIQVMYAGEMIETGTTEQIIHSPHHPYTYALLDSRPGNSVGNQKRIPKTPLPSIPGIVPAFNQRPEGCQFWPRCPYANHVCKEEIIGFKQTGQVSGHRCLFPLNEKQS